MALMCTDPCSVSMSVLASLAITPQSSRQTCAALPARGLCLFTAGIAIWMTLSCATPHAVLNFSAPSTATAGTPFTITVNVTIEGTPDTIINSIISFTSSDPAAVLPSQYQFTSSDAGSHTWTNGFTLVTPGNQPPSATSFDATRINGTDSVTVTP